MLSSHFSGAVVVVAVIAAVVAFVRSPAFRGRWESRLQPVFVVVFAL
jgi:hypothetical protein